MAVAIGAERRERLALDERGGGAARALHVLERAYETAGKDYDGRGQREAGGRLEAFAKELKRDPQLDRLLRARGRDLGVGEGSRLDQVVGVPEPELDPQPPFVEVLT